MTETILFIVFLVGLICLIVFVDSRFPRSGLPQPPEQVQENYRIDRSSDLEAPVSELQKLKQKSNS